MAMCAISANLLTETLPSFLLKGILDPEARFTLEDLQQADPSLAKQYRAMLGTPLCELGLATEGDSDSDGESMLSFQRTVSSSEVPGQNDLRSSLLETLPRCRGAPSRWRPCQATAAPTLYSCATVASPCSKCFA